MMSIWQLSLLSLLLVAPLRVQTNELDELLDMPFFGNATTFWKEMNADFWIFDGNRSSHEYNNYLRTVNDTTYRLEKDLIDIGDKLLDKIASHTKVEMFNYGLLHKIVTIADTIAKHSEKRYVFLSKMKIVVYLRKQWCEDEYQYTSKILDPNYVGPREAQLKAFVENGSYQDVASLESERPIVENAFKQYVRKPYYKLVEDYLDELKDMPEEVFTDDFIRTQWEATKKMFGRFKDWATPHRKDQLKNELSTALKKFMAISQKANAELETERRAIWLWIMRNRGIKTPEAQSKREKSASLANKLNYGNSIINRYLKEMERGGLDMGGDWFERYCKDFC